MNRQMQVAHLLMVVGTFLLLMSSFFHFAYAGSGNAEVSRTRNLQIFQMVPSEHPPGNSSITRTRNLQFFQMTPQQHPPGNALVTRLKNLEFFQMAPVGPLLVSITSFVTTDQEGNTKTSFRPGNTILFKVTIYGSGMQDIPNALISVMAQDPRLTTAFLSYYYENIDSGKQTTLYTGLRLPYNCTLGTYVASVNIFTQLPSQGGLAIDGGHAETQFTVS